MSTSKDIQFASDLRGVIVKLIKRLRKESPAGQQLSLTERSTMALLSQHTALLPSELAAMEMITSQSMSQVLNHLSELGFIARAQSESDKRKVNISLSACGKDVLAKFRGERDRWLLGAIVSVCTPEEQAILKQAIAPLTKLADFTENK